MEEKRFVWGDEGESEPRWALALSLALGFSILFMIGGSILVGHVIHGARRTVEVETKGDYR